MSQIGSTEAQIRSQLEAKGFDFSGILAVLLQSVVPLIIERLSSGCGVTETDDQKAARVSQFVTTAAGRAQLIREVRKSSSGHLDNIQVVMMANAIAAQLEQKVVVMSLIDESRKIDEWQLV